MENPLADKLREMAGGVANGEVLRAAAAELEALEWKVRALVRQVEGATSDRDTARCWADAIALECKTLRDKLGLRVVASEPELRLMTNLLRHYRSHGMETEASLVQSLIHRLFPDPESASMPAKVTLV